LSSLQLQSQASPHLAVPKGANQFILRSSSGVDLETRPNSCVQMNLTDTPLRTNTFDAIICIHVLEHIEKDQEAMSELFRVLKPGGWAVLSVPIQLKEKTFEDPSITAPHERKRAFGEEEHVRIYGYDLVDRLETCGFSVELDLASRIQESTIMKYGLLADEQVLYCTKAGLSNVGEIENNAT
jgi:SAM-dependent methyltransferase